MLRHHANSELLADQWARYVLQLAVEPDLTRIALHRASKDPRDGAFTRPILTDDGVNLTAVGSQINRAQGLRTAEPLADAAHLQKWCHAASTLLMSSVVCSAMSRSVSC